jgi:hypothetical protein
MPVRQVVFFLVLVAVLLLVIVELVRRRALRVEYSWLWIGACVTTAIFIVRYDLLIALTDLIGAVVPTSTLFFLCILYLALLCLHYSIRISRLTHQVKDLAQELALLRTEVERQETGRSAAPRPDASANAG